MSSIKSRSIEWGQKKLSIESGRIARNCHSSVIASYGKTSVLVTVSIESPDNFGFVKPKPFSDGVGLVVFFISKAYAMGKFPGGFFKREGKPGERDTLAARLIDRSIRPLIPKAFQREINIVCSLIDHDPSVIPEIPAIIGASAALASSEVPLRGLSVGAHVTNNTDSQFLLNCHRKEISQHLDLFVSGNRESITAVESSSIEKSEDFISDAISFAHEKMSPVFDLIDDFACDDSMKSPISDKDNEHFNALKKKISSMCIERLRDAYHTVSMDSRPRVLMAIRREVADKILSDQDNNLSLDDLDSMFKNLEKQIVVEMVIQENKRVDGRSVDEVREISIETDVLNYSHGSALFTRGGTQSLTSITLGTQQDEQIVDDIDSDRRESFMLHYNFPPYSVGDLGPFRGPGRREIGHGKLAYKALQSLIPSQEDFPYTIRVVSEITESDGSSSMATVCAASLALMSAGVPIKKNIAGVAMGLIHTPEKYSVLTDILGSEDEIGDMDFKVAGTEEGITALQMDIKSNVITHEIIKEALSKAKKARLHILKKINSFIDSPSQEIKNNAPRILRFQIDSSKVSRIIGARGRTIRDISESTNSKVEISDNGQVSINSSCQRDAENAKSKILQLSSDPEIGAVYDAVVNKIESFGMFVKFLGESQGLVHITEIKHERIDSIKDFFQEGQTLKVLVLDFERGRVRLSAKRVNQEDGSIIEIDNVESNESDIGNSRKTKLNQKPFSPYAKKSLPYSQKRNYTRNNANSTKSFGNDSSSPRYEQEDDYSPKRPSGKRKRFF